MKSIVISIALSLITTLTFAQAKKYRISSKGESIGTLMMNERNNDGTKHIEVVSQMKVKVVVTVGLMYKLNTVFKNGELHYSSVTTYVNGKVHSTSISENKGDHYLLTLDGHQTKKFMKIKFSEAMMYLTEPVGHKWIYSEIDDIMKPIKSLGNHVYEVTNPKNGHKSKYYYKNGILEKTDIPESIVPFFLELI